MFVAIKNWVKFKRFRDMLWRSLNVRINRLLLVPRSTMNKFNSLKSTLLLVLLKELLYMLTTNIWKQIKNTIPFTVAPKNMKYLGINLTGHV